MENQELNPVQDPVIRANEIADANEVLALGIIAISLLCLSFMISTIFAIPAIVLASIAIRKANALKATGGLFSTKPRVGYILAKVTKPLAIIQVIGWVLALLLLVALFVFYGCTMVAVLGTSCRRSTTAPSRPRS